METGYARRLSRLAGGPHGRPLLVAMDHGLTGGPPPGLEQFALAAPWIDHPAVDGVVVHRGGLRRLTHLGLALDKTVVLQSNGMSRLAANSSDKPLLADLEDAVRLGADAVSLEFAGEKGSFGESLRAIAAHVRAAERLGLPSMVMVGLSDAPQSSEEWIDVHRAVVRALVEVGAAMVKLRQPPSPQDWSGLLEDVCHDVLVVMAGGPSGSTESVLANFRSGLTAGADGVCVGRSVFQHAVPTDFLTEVGQLLRGAGAAAASIAVNSYGPRGIAQVLLERSESEEATSGQRS